MARGNCCAVLSIARAARKLDQWSYYQDGFEVYREEDLDGDQALDECRWLNAGGTRIAQIEKGQIRDGSKSRPKRRRRCWFRHSRRGDIGLLETVMATPDGSDGGRCTQGDRRQGRRGRPTKRADVVADLQKKLIGWNKQTIWNRFDGTFPHVIPADPASGLAKDLTSTKTPWSSRGRRPRSRIRPSSRSCRFPT